MACRKGKPLRTRGKSRIETAYGALYVHRFVYLALSAFRDIVMIHLQFITSPLISMKADYKRKGDIMTNIYITEINVPYPEAADLHLKVSVGACRLKVTPGDGEAWVTGTYRHPSGVLPPRIVTEGGTVRITQRRNVADLGGLFSGTPRYELALGKARPYMLTLEVGASEGNFDLGGLPINHLVIRQGAGKVDFDFSAPNPQAMSLLHIDAGAVDLGMKNLANANFAEMRVGGGAAAYKFDFSGTLERDAQVKITTGVSSVEIHVPASTAAKITSQSVLGGLDIGDGFTKKEGAFWTEAALGGKTPVLTIHANISVGSLLIRTT